MVLWEVLRKNGASRQVSIEEIEAAEKANVEFLERLDAGSEMDYMDGMQELMSTYNQMPLLGAVIEGG